MGFSERRLPQIPSHSRREKGFSFHQMPLTGVVLQRQTTNRCGAAAPDHQNDASRNGCPSHRLNHRFLENCSNTHTNRTVKSYQKVVLYMSFPVFLRGCQIAVAPLDFGPLLFVGKRRKKTISASWSFMHLIKDLGNRRKSWQAANGQYIDYFLHCPLLT